MASQVVLVVRNPPTNEGDVRDMGLIPGLRRSPGGGHANLLQYSCLENLMDRGVWQVLAHRIAKSRTRLKWLSTHAQHNLYLVIIFYCQSLSTPRPHPSPVECRLHKSKGIFSFLHLYDPRPRTVATQWAHHKHLQDRWSVISFVPVPLLSERSNPAT